MNRGKSQAYRGFQTWRSAFLMRIEMLFKVFLICIVVHVVVVASYMALRFDLGALLSSAHQYVTLILTENLNHLLDGKAFEYGSQALKTRVQLEGVFIYHWHKIYQVVRGTLFVYILVPVILFFFSRRAQRESATMHLRGSQLKSPEEVRKAIEKEGEETDIAIGEIKMPVSMESQHTYIIGTTGTGKTALLRQILDRIRARGECAIIYDMKGDFLSTFYDPSRDFIFNPLDKRCVGWNVFNDIKTVQDIQSFAASLIPDGVGDAVYWNGAARDILVGNIYHLIATGKTTNRDLWEALSSSARELRRIVASTEGGKAALRHLEDPTSKQAGSAISTLMNFVNVLRYMADIDGDFSFHEWVRKREGWIFIENRPDVQALLKPILSLAVDIVAKQIMCLPDDIDRRIFIMIDELGTLQQLQGLVDLITLGRSKGASLLLATQDLGRVNQVYGKDIAATIFNNCSTRLYFRVNDPETAEYLERALGEREISCVDDTISLGPDERKAGLSFARKTKSEKIVLASEMMDMRNLQFYLKMGHYDATKTSIKYRAYPVKNEIFEMRNDLSLSSIKLVNEKIIEKPWERPFWGK